MPSVLARTFTLFALAATVPAGALAAQPSAAQPSAAARQKDQLEAQASQIDIRDGDTLSKGTWTLNEAMNPDIYTVKLDKGERREVCFQSGPNALCRTVKIGDSHDFVVTYAGKSYPHRILGRYVRPTTYSPAYIAANKGTEQFLIPEGYELANIIISLTPYGKNYRNRIFQNTDYYKQVQAHFGAFADHPLIAKLNFKDDKDFRRFIGFRENGAYWTFQGNKLVQTGPYIHHWEDPDINLFADNLVLVEDFAKKSGFRAFFASHKPYYATLVDDFSRAAPLSSMVDWLEASFGEGYRYDSYKVIFSPLVAFSHSASRGETPQYKESLMFVGAPHVFGEGDLAGAEVARMIFTEIDHNFVNPTSELHKEMINEAISNVPFWNDVKVSGGYSDPWSTFNEYMTWSVFSLWARDKYPADVFKYVVRINRYDMIERGFHEFIPFDQGVLKAYPAKTTKKIPQIYPEILAFARQHQAKTKPGTASSR